MSMLALGLLFGGVTLLVMFSGMPIAFALGLRRDRVHDLLHAGIVARYGHAERLRGDGEHHAAVDPAVHPEGRGDRPVARRPGPLLGAARLDEPHSRRPRHRQRVRLRAVRGDGGLEPGDLLGDRLGRHPGDAQARLFAGLRGRHHRRRRHARHPAAAVDHDDPLCRRGGAVARPAVPRRHRPGACCWSCSSPATRRGATARVRAAAAPRPRTALLGCSTSSYTLAPEVRRCCRACCRSCSC